MTSSARRKRIIIIAIVLVLFLPPGIAVAQTLSHNASAGVPYQTNSGLTVTLTDQRQVPAVPFQGSSTFRDSPIVISGSNGEISVGDQAYTGTDIRVTDVDSSGSGEITVERTDLSRNFTVVDGSAQILEVGNYTVDSGSIDIDYSSPSGVTLRLDSLPSVGVAAVDSSGSTLASDAVGNNGQATLELPSGSAANPDQLISGNASLRARFFSGGGDVIQREVTNGTVSLAGLPNDKPVIVTVKESNADYTYRRILLKSIVETSEIYLLPTDVPSAEVVFELEDRTNRFDAESTRLFIQKPITRNGNTKYRTISGDRFGSNGEFPTILIDSSRYRLVIENSQGERRVLGSYTVQGSDSTTLTIGEVEFTGEVDEGGAMQSNIREAPAGVSHDYEIRVVYVDPTGKTQSIEISITDESGQQLRPTTTEQLDGTTRYVETYPITSSTFDPTEETAEVEIDATRGERGLEEQSLDRSVGQAPESLTSAAIDDQVLELMGLVSILAVMGLIVLINAPIAALVGSGWAGMLTILGVVGIPFPAIILGGVVSILAVVGTQSGVIG
jgi:hypothetical protein